MEPNSSGKKRDFFFQTLVKYFREKNTIECACFVTSKTWEQLKTNVACSWIPGGYQGAII